jgi:hypothetical protein
MESVENSGELLLKHSHRMTPEDASTPRRLVWSGVHFPMEITLNRRIHRYGHVVAKILL